MAVVAAGGPLGWLIDLRTPSTGHHPNVSFADFRRLVEAAGFQAMRTSGSHIVFVHPAVTEHLSLQPYRGEAKPYQIRQFLTLMEQYT